MRAPLTTRRAAAVIGVGLLLLPVLGPGTASGAAATAPPGAPPPAERGVGPVGPAAPGSVVDQLLAPHDGVFGLGVFSSPSLAPAPTSESGGVRLGLDAFPLDFGPGPAGPGPVDLDPRLRLDPSHGRQQAERTAARSPRRGSPLLADLLRAQVEEGNIALAEARYADAVQAWKATTELLPKDYRLYVKLGEAHFGLGQFEQAEAAMARAIELNPRSHIAQCNYGVILFKRGKLAEADRALAEALRLSPDHAVIHLNLACVFASLGQTRQAVEFLRRALEENPRQLGQFILDPELDAIRQDAEFQAIYTQLAQADMIPQLRETSAVEVASTFEGVVAPVAEEDAAGTGPILSLRQPPSAMGLQLGNPLGQSTNAPPAELP